MCAKRKLIVMGRKKIRFRFSFRNTFLLPVKRIFVAVKSHLRTRARENRHGLAALCRDMEAFSGYSDIQVMWEMIKSSHQCSSQRA
nr:Prephenate decarboxylase [Ipomoea batatas]